MKTTIVAVTMVLAALSLYGKAADPLYSYWQCPGPNGGWGWRVIEDRNGDGKHDWEVVHECDGSICEGPIGMTGKRTIGYVSGWATASFAPVVCQSGSNGWSVQVTDADGNVMATVQRGCSSDSVEVILPSIELPAGLDFRTRSKLRRYAFVFDTVFAHWNGEAASLDLHCRVKKPMDVTVRVFERSSDESERVIKTETTTLTTAGEHIVRLQLPPVEPGRYYWEVMSLSERQGLSSTFVLPASSK
ncbi:MAG: hypothetical protein N3B17_03955 [Chlorobi bacterium]|nr:hypothetical protein [Chlorobiota bacterium]